MKKKKKIQSMQMGWGLEIAHGQQLKMPKF